MNYGRQGFWPERSGWYREGDCRLDDFVTVLNTREERVPHFAADVIQGIPVYECRGLERVLDAADDRTQLLSEWAEILRDGAGVFSAKACLRPYPMRRRRHRSFRINHSRREREGLESRPFCEGRCERPYLERAGKAVSQGT